MFNEQRVDGESILSAHFKMYYRIVKMMTTNISYILVILS